MNEYRKKYYQEHKDKILKYQRNYYNIRYNEDPEYYTILQRYYQAKIQELKDAPKFRKYVKQLLFEYEHPDLISPPKPTKPKGKGPRGLAAKKLKNKNV